MTLKTDEIFLFSPALFLWCSDIDYLLAKVWALIICSAEASLLRLFHRPYLPSYRQTRNDNAYEVASSIHFYDFS